MSVSPSERLHALILIAVMSAALCVLSPWSVPVGPVPVSLATLAIYLTVYLLGWRKGSLSVLIYLLIGLVGLPVFSGFTAGPGRLLGPTGGYLAGYLFLALISGLVIQRFRASRFLCVLGLVLGTVSLYVLGTAWLARLMRISLAEAVSAGVFPFLPGDILKIVLASILGPLLYQRLKTAGLLKD